MTAIAALDVAALKAECRRRRIDISCLLEKSELQAALLSARYYEDPEQDVACAVCGEFDDEEGNDLLLCDGAGCRAAHHLRCLSPPLLSVPAGCWLCPRCTDKSDRPVDRMPLGEVKAELLRRGVRTAGLLEKHEFCDALCAARAAAERPGGGGGGGGEEAAAAAKAPPPKAARPARPAKATERCSGGAPRRKARVRRVDDDRSSGEEEGEGQGRAAAPLKRHRAGARAERAVPSGEAARRGGEGSAAAAGGRSELGGAVARIVRESDLDLLTPRLVRAAVEERLGLPAGSLKAEREQIAQHIDRALRELRGERG